MMASSLSAKKYRSLEALVVLLSSLSSSAFAFSSRVHHVPSRTLSIRRTFSPQTPLSALIFGWDESEDSNNGEATATYTDVFNDAGGLASCSPVGSAVAEALSFDKDRAGHLARLAVVFSPPGHSLTLKDIQHVDVVCVRDDSIEIQAIICEDGGCVSVAVPVKFPKECSSGSNALLEGCVLRNLEELNEEAESTISIQNNDNLDKDDLEELCLMNGKIEYPSWWVPPECDAALVSECDSIQRLLNEEEFQPDIMALAQDTLRKNRQGGGEYIVKKARVAVVGPAGICFKVRAEYQVDANRPMHTLDVVYPFGGEPMKDTASLRAAVLGAVAAAEGD